MALEADIDLFAQVPALRLLGADALRILAISAEAKMLRDGDVLFHEGEEADAGYVVESGALSLQRGRGANMRETAVARRGALLGETVLLVETVWPGTATALEPSRVLRIPRGVFLRMLEGEPEGARKLRARLAAQLQHTIGEIDALRPRFETEDDERDGEARR